MTLVQRDQLLDMKAAIERCIIEDKYEECLSMLTNDSSSLLFPQVTAPMLFTKGEHGRIVLPTGFTL